MHNRRHFLKALGLLAAAPMLNAQGAASKDASSVQRLYRDATVIDGNLVIDFDEQGLSADAIAAIRRSGLTAFKNSIAGAQGSYTDALQEIKDLLGLIAHHPDLLMQIQSADDLTLAKRSGRTGIIFSFEASSVLEGKLERIEEFSGHGVRVMQLCYNLPSPFASGVLSPQPSSGLTALGREAVARMNALGVSIDLSHADAKSSLDAIRVSKRPVLITHAGCRAVYAHPRNKADQELRAVAQSGGVVGIYDLPYLSAGPAQQDLSIYLAHLTHALTVCGEDHVGIGSDSILTGFDTSPASMASYLQTVAARKAAGIGAPGEERPPYVVGLNRSDRCEVIANGLLGKGYPPSVVDKVLGANFARGFRETWTSSGAA
ncbi:MAG: membrane dipeptidase [Dyella sp.]